MVAEFSLICYKDIAGKSIGNANMPKVKQYHKYHNRLGDGNMMLNACLFFPPPKIEFGTMTWLQSQMFILFS